MTSILNEISNHELFKISGLKDYFNENPLKFIDIGARGGAHSVVYPIANITSVLAFEPDSKECLKIKNEINKNNIWNDFSIMDCAVYNKNGPVKINIINFDINNSILKPNSNFIERYKIGEKFIQIGEATVEAYTLDSILKAKKSLESHGEFIKIDTQGTEFEILEMATETLKNNTVGLLLEVCFSELYENQKLFSEVEQLVRKNGFKFYGFTSLHNRASKLFDKRKGPSSERYFFADALFLKDPLDNKKEIKKVETRHNRVLFLLALIYKFYDLCLELLSLGLFSSDLDTKGKLENLIQDLSHREKEKLLGNLRELDENKDVKNLHISIMNYINKNRSLTNVDDLLEISTLPSVMP